MVERELFEAAVELAPGDRPAFLDRVCAADAALRRRLEALLSQHDAAGSFLEAPAVPGAFTTDTSPAAVRTRIDAVGQVLAGRYELLEEIGEGGMGTVWMARQTEPVRRFVAVKLVKPGMDSRAVLARFEVERQALALMDHPNIARVHDAGTTPDGRPFFAMELVRGPAITAFCDDRRLTPRQRLELFVPVCHAIQHAHQKGVIHRDIKPGNVLVGLYDGGPVPKVIDFGVAKATGQPLTEQGPDTGVGAVIGTVEYMSPEQASLNPLDVDTRTDVYGLGVLLYELLTGTTPLARGCLPKPTLFEGLRIIREEEPTRPSARLSTTAQLSGIAADRGLEPRQLCREVRGELDWIVLKCLEKDRDRRYGSASELAREVERYLSDEPVLACPPSAWYRLRKFVRRHRTPVLSGLALLALLVVGLGLALAGYVQVRRAYELLHEEQGRTADALNQERQTRYFHQIALAHREWQAGRGRRTDHLVGLCPEEFRDWEWHYLHRLCYSDLRTLRAGGGVVGGVAFAPDGKRLASGHGDGTVRVWQVATGKEELRLRGHTATVRCVAYSPDGTRLASAALDGTVRLWDPSTGPEAIVLTAEQPVVRKLAYSPDGKRLAVAGSGLTVWDAGTRRQLFNIPEAADVEGAVAFSPDGSRLAAGVGAQMKVLDASTGDDLHTLRGTGPFADAAFSPDGQTLAAASANAPGVTVWDTATTKVLATLRHFGPESVAWVAYSPDGKCLATPGPLNAVLLWNPRTGKQTDAIRGHTARVTGVAFNPDGRVVASASRDGTVKLWPLRGSRDALTIVCPGRIVGHALSPDGGWVAAVGYDGVVTVAEASLGGEVRQRKAYTSHGFAVAFSPDGTRLATTGLDGTAWHVKLWERDRLQPLRVFPRQADIQNAAASDVVFSPDGRRLASPGDDRSVKVWDAATGQELLSLRGHRRHVLAVAFSPDGTRLASADADGVARVWDAATGQELLVPRGHGAAVQAVAFSPDGRRLATGGNDRTVKLWDVNTGRELRTLEGFEGGVVGVAFGPGGRRLATAAANGTVMVWDPTAGAEALTLRPIASSAADVTFSPDGHRLVGGLGSNIVIWDATPRASEEPLVAPQSDR